MTTYIFRLILDAEPDADALFEAASTDDPFVETASGVWTVAFHRDRVSAVEGVLSAVEEVESVGCRVVRVEPDELVSAADIAERAGRTRQSISQLVAGDRGPGGWPEPVAGNARSALWRWADVAAWFAGYDGSQAVDREFAAAVAAVNEVLSARRALAEESIAPVRSRFDRLLSPL